MGMCAERGMVGRSPRRAWSADTQNMDSKVYVVGEHQFRVTRKGPALVTCDWLTGPNQDYGFSIGGTSMTFAPEGEPNPPPPTDVPEWVIRQHIEAFLEGIDPDTGYTRD